MKAIMVACTSLLSIVSAVSAANAQTPCDILAEGNKFFINGKWNQDAAIPVYEKILQVDSSGREECTASIYASLGTMYTLKAEEKIAQKDFEHSSKFYSFASKYNRDYGNAVLCNLKGDQCKK